MNGDERWGGDQHRSGGGHWADDGWHDPVKDFFAAHRAEVREQPADDLTWQRIRDGARRGRSTRRGTWAAGLVAAAAALAVVLGPSLLPDAGDPDLAGPQPTVTDPATGPTGTGEPTGDDPTGTEPTGTGDPSDDTTGDEPTGTEPTDDEPGSETVTTPVPEGELPEGARVTDVTTADPEPQTDTGVRFALAVAECPENGFCAILARSEDGGITWAPQADLQALGLVHRVTFTDHGRGWVWGDKAPVWGTTDGGRTWTAIRVGAASVQDLAVQQDELLATTITWGGAPCEDALCPASPGAVVLTDPTDTDWRDDAIGDLGPVADADVLDSAGTRYVLSTTDGAAPPVRLLRLQDGRLEATAALSECGAGPVAITASTMDPDLLWALCDDEFGLAAHQSTTGGRTWLPTNLTVPSFVLGEEPPLMASVGTDHLLLVGEGNYAVSKDAGQTWSAEAFLPGADARPERLEVTMFGEVIAYPTPEQASPDLAFWRSADDGATWEAVPVHR